MKKLAYEIMDLLKEYQCANDLMIYFGSSRLENVNGETVENPGYKASDYFEYCNLDTISMSFEGGFYDVINYGASEELLVKFEKLIESYGYMYEIGNSWNLALYEI